MSQPIYSKSNLCKVCEIREIRDNVNDTVSKDFQVSIISIGDAMEDFEDK